MGEDHAESKLRRDAERKFCLAKTGSADYWTEAEFPDLPKDGHQQAHGDPAADLMEFRATHGAAMLIAAIDRLGDEAVGVSATSASSAGPVVTAFDVKVKKLMLTRDRIDRSWRPSSPDVNLAVQAVYDSVESAFQAYNTAFLNAPPAKQLKAILDFGNSRVALRDKVPALADAVGAVVANKRDAAELAKYMRTQRSTFMGLGAIFSKRKAGVWKVGDLHITDLTSGSSNVDQSRINIVSQDDFNHALNQG
ncbi:MAG: hypothetical protein ABW224_17230 [Kibdelosporangium sp.]